MHVLGVCGARPNFIKIDPILRSLDARDGISTHLVHTGQHYDERMSQVFFEQLGIRRPDTNLEVGSGSHAQQTAAVMTGIESLLQDMPTDVVVVVGDVNSTMAATLAAAKLNIPVAHVEAGLRSFDRRMPEEINRLVTDAIADLLLTPSRDADENLRQEGADESRIFCVGNVMIDTLLRCRDLADETRVWDQVGVTPGEYALLTLHRPANVDHAEALARILTAVEHVQAQVDVVFPLHPRTKAKLDQHGLSERLKQMTRVHCIPPQSYLEFLALQARARLVLSDSGGVQEETTVLGVPCLTLRENTERPVTVTEGTNTLVGSDPEAIIREADRILSGQGKQGRIPELWDGRAAERVTDVLQKSI